MADQLIPPLSLPVLNERGLLDTRWAAFVRMLADAVNGTTGVVETRASYPSGLTIAGVASNASITVSAHTRQYASLAKPVQAGTVTGLTYGTTYYVYYDDLKRAGGLVSYAATTTLTDAFSSPTNPALHCSRLDHREALGAPGQTRSGRGLNVMKM